MNILRISCSPRGPEAESFRLSQYLVDTLCAAHGTSTVTECDVSALAHPDAAYADTLGGRAPSTAAGAERGALDRSAALIGQLQAADCVVIATPMHNYTVPSGLKAWIDHVVRIGVTFDGTPQGKIGRLPDRPVYIAISSGGQFSGDLARQPDFLTPYLRAVLETIGLKSVSFYSVEGTVRGAQALAEAHERANAAISADLASVVAARSA
ncbi:NAD(P)H dehydrogenase [Bordetella sp. N]|nr:NAD(P)H-dependent oxidoreductase [Bordetella sp. N]ALM84480.1 NAD(P)H dehydrogenase [Bordetella sp. N]